MFAVLAILLASLFDVPLKPDFIPGSEHVITGQAVAVFGTSCIVAGDTGRFRIIGDDFRNLHRGDRIAAQCRLVVHEHGITSHLADAIRILGHEPPPAPKDVTSEELNRGDCDLMLVRVRGTVDDIATDEVAPEYRIILLKSGNTALSIPIIREKTRLPCDIDRLLYAEVEVTGVLCKGYPSSRFFKEPTFLLSDEAPMRLIHPASADIFDRPSLPSKRVFTPDEITMLGLRSVTGTVIAVWGKDNFLLSPPDQGYVKCRRVEICHRVELPFGCAAPSVGMRVQVVGQPETDTYRINFSRASWRPIPDSPPSLPEPQPCKLKDLVRGRNDRTFYNAYAYGRTVQLTGRLSALPLAGSADARLHLLIDGIDVAVDASACPDAIRGLEPDSVLRISGVCLFEIDNWRANAPRPKIRQMVIVARTANDIAVVRRPPWWTIGRMAVLVGGLLLVLGVVLVWNRILNRIVIRRSRELLREQTAHTSSELRIGERTRLAVELHDTLSQNLAGVACQVASAQNAVGQDEKKLRKRLTSAERILKSCRTELRQVLSDLRSNALEQDSLKDAIEMVLEDVIGDATLSIRFNVPRARLLDSTAHAILCIVRELAGNAVRHGGATSVWIAGALERDRLLFSVRDNGTGFDPATSPGPAQGHFGLDGIRNRINRFDGTVRLDAVPGKGVHAVIAIPLPGHDDKDSQA